MNDKDYAKLNEFAYISGGLIPSNQNAHELINQTAEGEVIQLLEVTSRDLKFHRCYFALLNYIWSWLPLAFKSKVPKEKFYIWLKHLKGQYKVMFEFKDGTKLVEYDSVSFGRMSQLAFEDHIREQLPFVYANVVAVYFKDDKYDLMIENIEHEFVKFLEKL